MHELAPLVMLLMFHYQSTVLDLKDATETPTVIPQSYTIVIPQSDLAFTKKENADTIQRFKYFLIQRFKNQGFQSRNDKERDWDPNYSDELLLQEDGSEIISPKSEASVQKKD